MSETGSAPSSSAGEGSGGSGSGQTSDPGKSGAVQEIATNEAMFAKLPADVIGLICDQLDQKSRLAILGVNRASNKIGAVRRKVEAYEKGAQDHVANSLATGGVWEKYRNDLPGLLGGIHDTPYANEVRDPGTTDFTGYVYTYLSNAKTPAQVINFVSSLHISAQAACRLNANYKGLFEGMIEQSMAHVNSLNDPKIVTPAEHEKIKSLIGQLGTMRRKLQDIRTISDPG